MSQMPVSGPPPPPDPFAPSSGPWYARRWFVALVMLMIGGGLGFLLGRATSKDTGRRADPGPVPTPTAVTGAPSPSASPNGTPSGTPSGIPPGAKVIGTDTASGAFATVVVRGEATDPSRILLQITATPAQRVDSSWVVTCLGGTAPGATQGHLVARTPIVRPLPLPAGASGDCLVVATGSLTSASGSGTIALRIYRI